MPNGLFSNLLKLTAGITQLENYFTELVTYLFQKDRNLLTEWLIDSVGIQVSPDSEFKVESQVPYPALSGSSQNGTGRIDIVIEIINPLSYDILFVESKIGSQESSGQLSGYAKVLADCHPDARQRWLIYITRDPEPKDEATILAGLPIEFRPLRWRDFYLFLSRHKSSKDFLAHEILEFMEENGMSHRTQLTPSDLLALSNLFSVLSFLSDTLEGTLRIQFENLFGKSQVSFERKRGTFSLISPGASLTCEIGYYFPHQLNEYPRLGVNIWASHKSPYKVDADTLEALDKLDGTNGWEKSMSGYYTILEKLRSLNSFLGEEDHLNSIQIYFQDLLKEVEIFMYDNPSLPWPRKTT